MIGREASVGKSRGIIVGYVEWGEKRKIQYVWIKFGEVIGKLIKFTDVKVHKVR